MAAIGSLGGGRLGRRVGDSVLGIVDGVLDLLARMGSFGAFAVRAVAGVPVTLRRYPGEYLRQLSDIAWGTGALLIGGGTIGIMVLLSVAAGTSLGIEGFSGLELLSLGPLTGAINAGVSTRELAPLIAALALASQVGCRFTSQLGSMRLHEEIDALSVMAVPPMYYLVTTRVAATMTAILPLYYIGLIGSWVASKAVVTVVFGQSGGTYEHYFSQFLSGRDILISTFKILVFTLIVALLHCWYGFHASGGPAGVGEATGRAIRASIVSVILLDMVFTLFFYGTDPGVRISG
ncbi:MlaE family ABC transporter permease [Nocardioides antri]|uniref:ABC transporter permease n=1 Tax=Nocardioides antri TaxID=2607659 RepID=A0A5B1M1G7_9ACTN|nr:ABC transporter permease [Nocardioides antri]KAA1426985.1 ABC transporter permease [Nocardioides antri]